MYQTPHGTKAVIFDLDDTLAPSKSPLDPSMATALVSLLQRLPVCIISGGRFEQFQAQVLDQLTAPEQILSRLHLMPTCGTRYYCSSVIGLMRWGMIIQYWPWACHASLSRVGRTRLP